MPNPTFTFGPSCRRLTLGAAVSATFGTLALVAGGMPAGYAADDGVALHFIDDRLHAAVASRPDAFAYRVELVAGRVVETVLPTRLIA